MLFAVVITTLSKFIIHDIQDCGWGKTIFHSIAIFRLKVRTDILKARIYILDRHYSSKVWGR